MITGGSHTLHSNLTESLNYFRQQLERQKLEQAANPKDEISQLPAPVEPTQPKSYEVVGELNQISKSDQLKLAAEERRDIAREAAVAVESLQHKKDVINVYSSAASEANDDSSNSSYEVSPGEVYQETLDYQKRQDLMSALQQAARPEQLGTTIDITV
jgi:hypothetical protein